MVTLSAFGQTFFIAVFGGDIRAKFDLTNGEWGLIYMAGTLVSAVAMLFAGGIVDRVKVRVIGIGVVACLALSCLAMALNSTVWMLVIIIFALRFFGQGMAHHVGAVAISRWFVAMRGRALATASLGYMLAEAALPLTVVWLKTQMSWETVWIGCAVITALMTPVLYQLLALERTPQSVADDPDAVGMGGQHWTRAQALTHQLFWALAPSVFLFPAFGTAFWFHQVHFAEIKGWEHLTLVAVFPLGTFSFFAFTFIYGWGIDKFGPGRLFPLYLLPLCIAFSLHWYAPTIAWSAAGVMFMGMAGGGAATLPTAVWATYYGTAHIGSIKSAVTALMVLGSAIGPGLSGWLIDAGIRFEVQLLAYASTFLAAALISIAPLRHASRSLPVAT